MFKDAVKKGKGFTIIEVNVIPSAKKTQIPSGYNEWRKAIEIRIKSQAKEGKANREIIKEMKRIFQSEVEIIKGERSNQKTLRVLRDYESVIKILEEKFRRL
jgi:hypothetical protein